MKKILLMLIFVTILSFGCSNSTSSDIPSGKNCSENIAYLQSGVDNYFQSFSEYPTDVTQLLATKDGKGPFVQVVPKCPSGNKYVINNGKVIEVH